MHERDERKTREYEICTSITGGGIGFRKNYVKHLAPYSLFRSHMWPACQIGPLARVAMEYQPVHINLGMLEGLIKQEDSGFSNMPTEEFVAQLRRVIAQIGMMSYGPEWKNSESQRQIKDKIQDSTDMPELMNRILAQVSSQHAVNVYDRLASFPRSTGKRNNYRIMDLGCGVVGTTIISHLEMLHRLSEQKIVPRNYNDYIHVVLVDVDSEATDCVSNILSRPGSYGKMFKPPRQVTKFNINFLDLDRDVELRQYEGGVDTIIGGASLCHVTDLSSLFSHLSFLTSSRGAVFIWDWLAKTFSAMGLRYPRVSENGGCFIFQLSDKTGGVEEVVVRDMNRFPWKLYDRIKYLKKNEWRSVYELREEDIAANHSNMYAWLGYWGFIRRMMNGEVQQASIDGIDIWEYYHDLFDEKADTARGFSPITDLVIRTLSLGGKRGLLPLGRERVRYNFIESYGPENFSKMKESGFTAVDVQFDDISRLLQCMPVADEVDVFRLNERQRIIRHALRISIGCKNPDYFSQIVPFAGNGR